jgi:hypothetical protein
MDFQLAKFYSPHGVNSDIISTWAALNDELLKNKKFGKYLRRNSGEAKKILKEELELDGLDENTKAKRIINYVKNSFEWNGSYGKYTSQSAKDFANKKNGNVADINLFLITLLKEADIDAHPVILSTRNHGKIPLDYPFDHLTNYVIAMVNTDFPFLADGTEEFLPFNKLPARCLNEKGLVVNKDDQPIWISLRNNFLSMERQVITLSIDTLTLDVKTKILIQGTEYKSFSNRNKFKDDTLQIKEYYSSKIGSINRIKTVGYKSLSFPYSINFEGDYETEKLGDNIVIKPFLDLPLSSNKLIQKERTYPVDFVYPWEEQFESNLEIPKGFSLTDLPEGYELDNDLADINLDYTLTDNILTAKGNYKFKKAIYVASEYSRIKYYMDQIVKYFNQPIVLEINN